MNKFLSESDIESAADRLGVEPAAIKAVCEVEAPGSGFLRDGRPKILFERHKFHKFTRGRYAAAHPDISSSTPGGYARGRSAEERGAREWDRMTLAISLDRRAALMAASWGRFQIMGFNFAHCGFQNVDEFSQAMHESEGAQLEAFVDLVESFGLADELRRHDWSGFAYGYNGPKYKQNQYDRKLARAFARYSAEEPRPATIDEDPPEDRAPERGSDRRPTMQSSPTDPPINATKDSRPAWITTATTMATSLGAGAWAILQNNQKLLYIVAGVGALALILWFIRGIILDRERLRLNADPEKFNVH